MNLESLIIEMADVTSPSSEADPIDFIMNNFPLMINEIQALRTQVVLLESQILSYDDEPDKP